MGKHKSAREKAHIYEQRRSIVKREPVYRDREERRGTPSPLPSEPCMRCGARGWCGHDHRRPELHA